MIASSNRRGVVELQWSSGNYDHLNSSKTRNLREFDPHASEMLMITPWFDWLAGCDAFLPLKLLDMYSQFFLESLLNDA